MVVLSKTDGTIALDDTEAIRKSMRNYRVVIPFLIMGGEVGTAIIRSVISSAREEECKVVSVLGIPFEMEQDRRKRALDNLSDVVALSDCSLVFDMQIALKNSMEVYKDRNFDFFLKIIDRMIMMSIDSVISCLEGPFFSVFKEKLYSFSSTNDVLPRNAAQTAMRTLLFDDSTFKDSCILTVSSHLSTAEIDDLRDFIAREFGILPDIIRRTDSDDTKIMVFKAVGSF
jgi:cell division GTPase FtsZ